MQTQSILSQAATKNIESCSIAPQIASFISTYHWIAAGVVAVYLATTIFLAIRKKIDWGWVILPALIASLFSISLYLLF